MTRIIYTNSLPSITSIRFYCSVNAAKVYLQPNTYYYFRPYVIQNNTQYWGSLQYFRTKAISVSLSSTYASKVTATSAQVSSLLTYYAPVKASIVVMYLVTRNVSRLVGTDTSIPKGSLFRFWYDVTSLKPGTKYYMLPFAVISGRAYFGSAVGFSTLQSSTVGAYTAETNGIYIRQKTGMVVCIAAAVTMRIRNYLYRMGKNYTGTTLEVLMQYCWGLGGLATPFTYNGITVTDNGYTNLTGYNVAQKKQIIAALLRTHPEGLALYNWYRPHAIYLHDLTNGVYYVGDSGRYQTPGRIPITSSIITYNPQSQDDCIASIDIIWYIAHIASEASPAERTRENLRLLTPHRVNASSDPVADKSD